MKNNNLTYEKSGVNIKAADNFVKFISSLTKKRQNTTNFQNIGYLVDYFDKFRNNLAKKTLKSFLKSVSNNNYGSSKT